MKKLLIVESSPRITDSESRKISRHLVDGFLTKFPNLEVITQDLGYSPLPHLNEAAIQAFYLPPEKRNAHQAEAIRLSDQLVDELLEADTLVLGVAMWNFSLPSVLKAWIDHISRAGRTFSYSSEGPKGLLTGKKAYVVIASGGVYSQGPYKAYDFVEPYLRAVLGFLGLTDVTVIRVEGMNVAAEKEKSIHRAREAAREAVEGPAKAEAVTAA